MEGVYTSEVLLISVISDVKTRNSSQREFWDLGNNKSKFCHQQIVLPGGGAIIHMLCSAGNSDNSMKGSEIW